MKTSNARIATFVGFVALLIWAPLSLAMSPYFKGQSVQAGDVPSVMVQVEKKLQGAGFSIIGTYQPKGIADAGVVVVTDKGILDAVRSVGGDVVVGAAVRVGVRADGSVSYMNPEYWYRAYFRDKYSSAEPAVKALDGKLKATLGSGDQFGGEVEVGDLPKYHYMFGMEYFTDNRKLNSFPTFEKAVETIRENLSKGVAGTSKIYEIVIPEKKIAVFGVAMNDAKTGDGVWVNRINGVDNIAALPYEIFVTDGEAQALFARYRIALSWSSLKMTSFGKIMATPSNIKTTLSKVAGAE